MENSLMRMFDTVNRATPLWVKEAVTVSIGVVGGLTLFQWVKKHIK